MPHFDLNVSRATINQLLGFLAAKGFAVDFEARELDKYTLCIETYETLRQDQ